jgi:hypothetical protein
MPLVTRLLKTMGLLRRSIAAEHTDVSAAEGGEGVPLTTCDGVPLVLPFDSERRLMPRLLRRLRRGRFLRRCPASLDEYASLTPKATRYFLDRLYVVHADEWKEGVTSAWALGRLAYDDPLRTEARALLRRCAASRGDIGVYRYGLRAERRWLAIWRNLFGIVSLWGAAVILNHHARFGAGHSVFPPLLEMATFAACETLILSFPVTLLSFLVSLPLDVVRMDRIRAMAVLTLGRWREPRHLDIFLRKCVGEAGPRVRQAAEIALHEVLPLLRAEEGGEHAADFIPNLCRAVQRKERRVLGYTEWEETLEILLLEALGKVGDGRALPTVERIAKRGRTPRLQELAQSILPVVQARARRTTDPSQLLRGAVRPDPAVTTLLRPAQEIATPSSELLRPR